MKIDNIVDNACSENSTPGILILHT